MKKILLIIAVITILSGCGTNDSLTCSVDNTVNNITSKTNYVIDYKDNDIKMIRLTYDYKSNNNDGDFTELCYYNYSKDLNNYDYAKPICIKNGNKEKENTISITNAITNMIKVQAKDQGGNTSGYTECATNIDIVKPFTPFASFLRNNDGNGTGTRRDGNTGRIER